jgi:uncharacterized protein YcnI
MSRTALTLARVVVVAIVAGVAMVLGGYTAFAHVSVSADDPVPGSNTKATFRVPNERPAVSTVRVEVVFPTDHPLGRASVAPVPGWVATVKTRKLDVPISHHGAKMTEGVESITWEGGEIKPGEFVEFPVAIGPLPADADKLVFKSLQTYSDGEVVRWIETPQDGAPEPEYPAPVLSLAAKPAATASADGTDGLARVLGLVGVVTAFGALAACIAVLPAARRRVRPSAPDSPPVPAPTKERARV